MSLIERIAQIYPDWQKLKLTKIGYSVQRQDAIIGLAQLYNGADEIKHFDRTHFTAVTIGGRKFLYCPVGNICSWSEGDHDNKWCHWCKKYFSEMIAGIPIKIDSTIPDDRIRFEHPDGRKDEFKL